MRNLFTPWRYAYLVSGRREKGCLFCRVQRSRKDVENLVVFRGRHNLVLLNRYPYNNGHVMVVPNRHVGELVECEPVVLREMMTMAARCEKIFKDLYRAEGMNLGMNLGAAAGAGIRGHLHLHLVPRWVGDTNFVTVIGETRVTPETLELTREKLALQFRKVRAPRRRRVSRSRK